MSRPRALATLAVLLAFTLAGCLADPGPSDAADGPSAADDGAGSGEARGTSPNLWLLDGIRPVSNTRVSDGAEPSILADRNGEFLWIGDTSGGYYSTNNGTTWSKLPNFLLPSVVGDGWALAQDEAGTLYAAGLIGPAIDVAVSTDGKSWDSITRAAALSGTTDRPWLAARGDGEVVLFYFDGILVATGFFEHCARSTDGGATWLERNPAAGSPQGGNAVFDASGNFYYADDDGYVSKFAGSCAGAGGKSFFSGLGANNMIQVDVMDGAVFSAAAGPGNREIILSGARSFGAPDQLVVSGPAMKSGTFVTLSADPPRDRVAVAWYGSETPGDPSAAGFTGEFNVFVTVVENFWGAATQAHFRVTDIPNHVGDLCMGGIGCDGSADRDLLDYFMIDYDKWGGLHVAYGHDGHGSNAEVRYAHLTPAQIDEGLGHEAPAPEPPQPTSPDRVDLPPIADFQTTVDGLGIDVDGSGSFDPENGPLAFTWDWGDGATGSGRTASHTYEADGSYDVTLTVRDTGGQEAHRQQRVAVAAGASNHVPVAAMELSATRLDVGETLRLRDVSTDLDGDVVARWWDLGDGETRRDAQFTHVFTEPGTYEVWLTVEDDAGATDSDRQDVTVLAPVVEEAGGNGEGDRATPAPSLAFLVAALVLLVAARRGDRFL